jgi:hypothetical protein
VAMYGVLKGNPRAHERDSDADPHSELLIAMDAVQYRIAINVRSSRGPVAKRLIEYCIKDDLQHPTIDHAKALPFGWNPLQSGAQHHDGDSYPTTDPTPLEAFLENFCDTAQHEFSYHNGVIYSTMNLPGVYWRMRCPLIDIVGLYSNRLENPGMIEGGQGPAGGVDTAQKGFLTQTLRNVVAERAAGARKALVIAVHHPPFSGGGHMGSGDMLDDIDDCCRLAGVMPDAVLSAHSHNYQRFTRKLNFGGADWRIPYIVAGGGGRGMTRVSAQTGTTVDDHRLEQYDNGFGYLLVTATSTRLTFQYTSVDEHITDSFDSVSVDLTTHTFV